MATSLPPLILATHEYLPFRGGAAVYVHEIATAAQEAGFSVEVWTADRRPPAGAGEGDSQVSSNNSSGSPTVVRFLSSGRLTPQGLTQLAYGWWRRRRQLRAGSAAVMSVGAQMVFFWFDLLGILPASRTLVVFYGSEVLRFEKSWFWRWLARRYYARAGGFVTCSHYSAGVARNSGLLPPGAEVIVAECALPVAFTRRLPPNGAAQAADEPWRLLTVARLHPRKGQRQVAQALALLPEHLRRRVLYQMVGVGAASYRAEIAEECRLGGVAYEFLGGLDDDALAEAYARSTLYVQASRTLARSVEGFGISFLEAAFYGKPAVAFRSGGIAEAVREGKSALLVPEGDVAALATAIERLLDDPELRARMGKVGSEFVQSLSWTKSAEMIWKVASRIRAETSSDL